MLARAARFALFFVIPAVCMTAAPAMAHAETSPPAGWQACAAIGENLARLACFDRWSAAQQAPPAATRETATVDAGRPDDSTSSRQDRCHRGHGTALSRFWELEGDTSCDLFGIRGYRPISLSLVGSDGVNVQPASGNPLNSAASSQPYRKTETRIQLSVRTKLAQGLLARDGAGRDSLWFGYTQQSYWQVFTSSISRPFRSTDHEPEFVYVYPATADLPGGWRLRYAGLGLVHQSNGQSLPLSRSWNRVYLMTGAEHPGGFTVQGRIWQRIPEAEAGDDNPHISDYIGRAEVTGTWDFDANNTLALTWRTPLRSLGKGSVRAEWLRKIASKAPSPLGSLRFHVQLFSGYGDSLLDFNRRRTVLAAGLSLIDW
jgi:phospholipase A1/A2